MPWKKQFDIDDALARAMQAFWAHGYEATSMQDLVACMGINRGSLYATFGDKHNLFVRALKRYDEIHRRRWVDGLTLGATPRQAVVAAFREAANVALTESGRDGCLLVNSALELSPHDAEVAEIVGHGFAEMEAFFRDRIEAGQAAGEISAEVDPAATAQSLLSLFIGLRVLSRSRPEAPLLNGIVGQAEAMLH